MKRQDDLLRLFELPPKPRCWDYFDLECGHGVSLPASWPRVKKLPCTACGRLRGVARRKYGCPEGAT